MPPLLFEYLKFIFSCLLRCGIGSASSSWDILCMFSGFELLRSGDIWWTNTMSLCKCVIPQRVHPFWNYFGLWIFWPAFPVAFRRVISTELYTWIDVLLPLDRQPPLPGRLHCTAWNQREWLSSICWCSAHSKRTLVQQHDATLTDGSRLQALQTIISHRLELSKYRQYLCLWHQFTSVLITRPPEVAKLGRLLPPPQPLLLQSRLAKLRILSMFINDVSYLYIRRWFSDTCLGNHEFDLVSPYQATAQV